MSEVKQVIVIRKDLNMRKGKMISQGCHASTAVLLSKMNNQPINIASRNLTTLNNNARFVEYSMVIAKSSDLHEWLNNLSTKIVVGCDSEKELLSLYQEAKDSNLPCALIKDAGRTEFNNIATYTCIAIGPAGVDKLDPITGHLKLL